MLNIRKSSFLFSVFKPLTESTKKALKNDFIQQKLHQSSVYNQLFVQNVNLDSKAYNEMIDSMLEKNRLDKNFDITYLLIKYHGYNQNHIKQLIENMSLHSKYSNNAVNYLLKAKLNPDHFPNLKKNLIKNYVYYLMHKKYDYFKIQEILHDDLDYLINYLQILQQKRKFSELKSIYQLHEQQLTSVKQRYSYILDDDNIIKAPNQLLIHDQFSKLKIYLDSVLSAYRDNYLTFQQFGIHEQDVIFVDDDITEAADHLLSSDVTGFDSEQIIMKTKLDKKLQNNLALIQIANNTNVYIFDVLKLQRNQQFKQFLLNYLESNQIMKVGHTIGGDLGFVDKLLGQKVNVNNTVDISTLFKSKYKSQFSSLAYICEKLLNKQLSKYEQLTQWSQRPLRKAQLHYAGLDAYICLILLKSLQQ